MTNSSVCESYISNTLLFSTFCAWCEICKCSPLAETLPDWQQNTFVASPLRVTHQSSASHLSHSVTPPAARRQACTRPSLSRPVSQPAKPPAWSESERNNIPLSSPPAQAPSNAFWSLVSPGWEHASASAVCHALIFCDILVVACRDYFVNMIWQKIWVLVILLAPNY